MKPLLLSLLTISFLFSAATTEVEAYRKGFEHGLKMLEFQIENEGMSPQKIDVDFQYTVELNTKDLSTTDILYLQYLTARDGYQSTLIKGALIFGKFERLADAKPIAETLKRKYNFDAVTKELKPNDELYSYPVLLLKAYNKFEKMNLAAKEAKASAAQVNSFTEETIKPMIITQAKLERKPIVEQRPAIIEEQKSVMPIDQPKQVNAVIEKKELVKAPVLPPLLEQKPLEPKTLVSENNTTITPKEKEAIKEVKNEQKTVNTVVAAVEEVKPLQVPKIDQNVTKAEPKIELAAAQPINDTLNLKNDTKPGVKGVKNDTNNTKNDTQKIKNDTKIIEKVIVKDFPFMKEDINASIAQKPKDLNLEETIEAALAVYPDFNSEQLRADLLKLIVKTPWIDAEAVKTMPMSKGLLLQLLKVAKEKE